MLSWLFFLIFFVSFRTILHRSVTYLSSRLFSSICIVWSNVFKWTYLCLSNPVFMTLQEHVYFLLNEVETHCHYCRELFSHQVLPDCVCPNTSLVDVAMSALREEKQTLNSSAIRGAVKSNTNHFTPKVSACIRLVIALEMLTKLALIAVREGTLAAPYEHPAGPRLIVNWPRRIRRAFTPC